MEINKSPELVNVALIATEPEPPGGSKSNSLDRLLDQADQAVRMGNLQESRDYLTCIFEVLAGSPPNRLTAHGDSQYRIESFQMRRSA